MMIHSKTSLPKYNGRLREAVLTSTHNVCFEKKMTNIRFFLSETFSFGGEIFNIFE